MIKRSLLRYSFLFFIVFMLFLSNLFTSDVKAQIDTFEPEYGDLPEIDGYINQTIDEWKEATKTTISLNSTKSSTDIGLPIDFWIMQNDSGLFICIRLELENHENNEFIGVLISRTTAENFYDAKILQFSNIPNNDYEYLDLYIENDVYKKDTKKNGSAAAQLEDNAMIYEFEIPTNNSEAVEDVFLDYGEDFSFKIIFGNSKSFPSGIMKETIIKINIQYPPSNPNGFDYEQLFLVLSILTFSSLGALYAFYIYKIITLKKNLKKIR